MFLFERVVTKKLVGIHEVDNTSSINVHIAALTNSCRKLREPITSVLLRTVKQVFQRIDQFLPLAARIIYQGHKGERHFRLLVDGGINF